MYFFLSKLYLLPNLLLFSTSLERFTFVMAALVNPKLLRIQKKKSKVTYVVFLHDRSSRELFMRFSSKERASNRPH